MIRWSALPALARWALLGLGVRPVRGLVASSALALLMACSSAPNSTTTPAAAPQVVCVTSAGDFGGCGGYVASWGLVYWPTNDAGPSPAGQGECPAGDTHATGPGCPPGSACEVDFEDGGIASGKCR